MDTILCFTRSEGARAKERERERDRAEREAEKEGERAHRRKCVTSRGRSDLKKTLEEKKTWTICRVL